MILGIYSHHRINLVRTTIFSMLSYPQNLLETANLPSLCPFFIPATLSSWNIKVDIFQTILKSIDGCMDTSRNKLWVSWD